MAYLLDTNCLIQFLAGHKETATFHKHIHPDKLVVSYIRVGEIYDVAFAYANPQAHLSSFHQFLAHSPSRHYTKIDKASFALIENA